MSVESIRYQSTNALLSNPYLAQWSNRAPAPVSLQPSEGAKTANTGATDAAGVYMDLTPKLAQAALLALKSQFSTGKTVTETLKVAQNSSLPESISLTQTPTTAKNTIGTYDHLPKTNIGINHSLNLTSLNSLPQFHAFMSQMFETLNSVNQIPSASTKINDLNKNSMTGITAPFNNYYRRGYDQNSYDLLNSKLQYLAKQVDSPPTPSPITTTITPGNKTVTYSKDDVLIPPPNKDNQITNPYIDKLNVSYNSLVSSLQGDVASSSLSSFIQNLQHQAHGFSSSANIVNTSA